MSGEEPGDILDLPEKGVYTAAGPVKAELYAQVVSGELVVRGTVEVPLRACCARCMQFFSTTAGDSAFLRDYPGIRGTEEVDITADLREAILLNLPMFPLCSESCKGLCPQCGKELNEGSCECPEPSGTGLGDLLDKLDL